MFKSMFETNATHKMTPATFGEILVGDKFVSMQGQTAGLKYTKIDDTRADGKGFIDVFSYNDIVKPA